MTAQDVYRFKRCTNKKGGGGTADLDLGVLAASHSGVINRVYFDVKVTAKRGNTADHD